MAVKKRIEDAQGKDTFPFAQQLLIYKGKVLKDDTTMEENSVTENSFLVVMLTKVCYLYLFLISALFMKQCQTPTELVFLHFMFPPSSMSDVMLQFDLHHCVRLCAFLVLAPFILHLVWSICKF